MGGWRRGHARHAAAVRRPTTRSPISGAAPARRADQETDEPPAPPARRRGRPRAAPVADPTGATQLQSPRWGTGLKGGRLPKLKNPEMNPTSRPVRAVLVALGARDLRRSSSLGYGIGLLAPAAAAYGPPAGVRRPHPYTLRPMRLLFPVRRLERPRDPTPPAPRRRDQRPRGRVRGAVRRRDPRRVRRAPRRDPRGRRPRRAVRGRADTTRTWSAAASCEGAPQARERAAPEGPRRRPAGGLRGDPRGHASGRSACATSTSSSWAAWSSTRARSPR